MEKNIILLTYKSKKRIGFEWFKTIKGLKEFIESNEIEESDIFDCLKIDNAEDIDMNEVF